MSKIKEMKETQNDYIELTEICFFSIKIIAGIKLLLYISSIQFIIPLLSSFILSILIKLSSFDKCKFESSIISIFILKKQKNFQNKSKIISYIFEINF